MKIKTNELTGAALDWAVAKCEGFDTRNDCIVEFVNPQDNDDVLEFVCMADDEEHAKEQLYNAYIEPEFLSACWKNEYTPSTDWSQGGPIIEREKINTGWDDAGQPIAWLGYVSEYDVVAMYYGPTPLIAAMRCFCCSKLGDVVDIPEELCQQQSN